MQVINRIELKVNQQDALDLKNFRFLDAFKRIKISRKTLKQWLAALTALTKINLSCTLNTDSIEDPNLFESSIYLQEINLSSNSIRELDSNMFCSLKNLTSLDLLYNSISTLKEGIFKGLNNLRELLLSFNKLTTFPEDLFKDLVNLEYLTLNYNKIESMPDKLFLPLVSLKQLFLHCNKIFFKDQNGNVKENIFQGLTRLEHLNLSNNQISYLPQGLFQDLVNLKYLDLNNNKIESMPDRLFLPLVSLKMLGLGDNKITFKDKNGRIQEDVYQGLVRLETLNLQYNPIDYLPQRFFQDLVKLIEICLICDQIDNLSKFIPHNITIT